MERKPTRSWLNTQPPGSANLLLARVDELRAQLRQMDPQRLAARAGANWQEGGEGILRLELWGKPVEIACADFNARDMESGKTLGVSTQALIVYHLVTTDGMPEAGDWVSFSELPDGRFYTQAFQGYTGKELGRFFGDDLQRFKASALAIGGTPVANGDAAFAFRMLPRVSLAVVAWLGDEDFPSTYQVLFDAAISHHLPTDASAIAGSTLTRRLIAGGAT